MLGRWSRAWAIEYCFVTATPPDGYLDSHLNSRLRYRLHPHISLSMLCCSSIARWTSAVVVGGSAGWVAAGCAAAGCAATAVGEGGGALKVGGATTRTTTIA